MHHDNVSSYVFSGELIGVGYVYNQTGKPLAPVNLDVAVEDIEDEDVDVEDDAEIFHEVTDCCG